MTHEDRLAAYVDGELSAADRIAFEAQMRGDPAMAEAVERQRRLTARLAGAYAPVLDEPVPMRLTAAASAANDPGRSRFGLPQWAAVAASLVVGVLAGRALMPEQGPLTSRDGVLVAHGELAEALSSGLATDPGVIRVGLTFRTADGRYCRSFQSEMDHLAGLACREDGRWTAMTTTTFEPAKAPDYRTAGSDTPAAVLAAVDELIAGEPLDAAAERAARDRNWTTAPKR